MAIGSRSGPALALALALCACVAAPARSQTGGPRPLSLEEAVERAAASSEVVQAARGGVTTARGQQIGARAERLPQVNSSLGYTRTVISQFAGAGGGGGGGGGGSPDTTQVPACPAYVPNPALPLEQRVALLEAAVLCPPGSGAPGGGLGGIDISRAGFGSTNAYSLGLSLSQSLYSGGRIGAQNRIAEASLTSAELEVTAQGAQLVVDVTEAYYDALLSARLLEIAEGSLAQAEETLRLSELGFQVGDKAEFDVLRARVARNNQRNAVLQTRSSRDLAFFTLKQLVDLPLDEPVQLTTPLTADASTAALTDWIPPAAGDTAAAARVTVLQAEQTVRIQEGQVAIARSQGRPNVSVVSNYGLTAYPQDLLPRRSDFADNLTVGLQVSVPVFDGGRVRGSVVQAQGGLEQARARLAQTREGAVLDARSRVEAVETALATFQSTAGSVEEAQRAYEVAQLRYQQGISTLIEVNDARIALDQAQADRARAARNLYVARVQLRLIRDLPLGAGGAASFGAAGTAGASSTGAGFGGATGAATGGSAAGARGGAAGAGAAGAARNQGTGPGR
ncbi:TolC family protein [Longimicrobium sp.]|uniref:TolC family protein n=1 Tax=Longimicrobium sp. TaxID=2029185 RepID=UPI002E2EEE65|nr:TolC family protein [Longimicrobium sp.]HEX6036745.1 TolC family protein [Longimicrobium sp.]